MNCSDARQLLHAYIDDEVDVATAGRVNAHLLECSACAQAFEAAKAVKIAIGNPALYQPSPSDLRERVTASIPTTATTSAKASKRLLRPSIWRAAALVASILLIVGICYSALTRAQASELNELAVLDLHLRSMQLPEHLVDVVSTDQHTVKPWFDGKLDFAPPVWQLASSGYPLVGGRIDYIHNRPVAALVYRRALHVINLFIWPGTTTPSHDVLHGYNLAQWTAGGMTFCAVSDVSAVDLEKFAEIFRAQP